MKISGKIISSTPITVSKAASILSRFVSAETGASQAVSAYLRRATVAFDELVRLHSKTDRKKHKKHKLDASTVNAAAVTSYEKEVSQGRNSHRIDFGNIVKEESKMVKSDIKEEKIQSVNKVKKKEKKEKGGAFGISQDNEGKVGIKRKKDQSHSEDNLVEETERKKHKKKKRDRDFVGNSEENGVEIANRESEIKREFKEEENTGYTNSKFEENVVKMELKEERKKRKNREVEEESMDEAEEQQRKKKKKKRRKVGE